MRTKMRDQRLKLNLSQQEVADRAGLTRGNYSHIERGRTEPNIEQMLSIAKVLKVEPNAKFFRSDCYDTEQKRSVV